MTELPMARRIDRPAHLRERVFPAMGLLEKELAEMIGVSRS